MDWNRYFVHVKAAHGLDGKELVLSVAVLIVAVSFEVSTVVLLVVVGIQPRPKHVSVIDMLVLLVVDVDAQGPEKHWVCISNAAMTTLDNHGASALATTTELRKLAAETEVKVSAQAQAGYSFITIESDSWKFSGMLKRTTQP